MKSLLFPSVLEKHNDELKNLSSNLIQSLKVYHEDTGYVVGELAMVEGKSPHKIVNSSPDDKDYQVLAKSSLVVLNKIINQPLILTVGFPYSTYQIFREDAANFFKGKHEVKHDIFTLGKNKGQNVGIEVESVEVIPEIIGCSLAVRSKKKVKGGCFVVNIGYGTFEACLTNDYGIVDRTVISRPGIRYAIDTAMRELSQKNYLGLRTEHQFDSSFQKGSIILSRKKIDLAPVRKNVLRKYFEEIISPAIRNTWQDDDFSISSDLYIAGGGAHYEDLIDYFREEFGDFLNIEVIDDPQYAVSQGYCYRSYRLSDDKSRSVGIDIGNAQTVISFYDEEEIG
ncbi:MAG: hypothetical protein SCALA702_26420 [Melioribacteraceae bacterium]|nr:MAG: hypothetical protein SCALA702_26420 [Melioribacteraceae bacterium]